MDQEIEKNCRNVYPIDFKTCSKHKQPRILTRNDKLVFLAFNVFVWAVFLAISTVRQPGDGIGIAIIGLEATLMTALTLHSLLKERLRPQCLAANIRRFPQDCRRSSDGVSAHANPDVLVAARHRCQSEESFAALEGLRRTEAKAERIGILAICGTLALIFTSLIWWMIRDITAEHVPMTWAEQVAQNQQTDLFMLHLLGYGALAATAVTILAVCINALLSRRKANAEERKRETALAAMARLPTGYRIAAVKPDDTEEPLECRLARIPHHLRSPDIEDYIASVDPAESGYRTYPTRACGT